jgi:hypothetical protein
MYCFFVSFEACRDEGWHLERLSQGGAAAVDMAAPSALSTVARLRSEAREAGDLLVVELAEFAHFDAHGDGGDGANTEDRDEDLETHQQFRLASQLGLERCVDGGCELAWKRDPVSGIIGVQSGPLWRWGSRWLS